METASSPPAVAQRRPRDLALSLLVLLVPVALVIGIYRYVLEGDAPVVIDPSPTIAEASADRAFPVAVPRGLSERWRPVSASYQRGDGAAVLRLGYLTPDDVGVQLVESDVPAETLLPRELTAQGRPEGVVEIGGRKWQRYTARAGEVALVLLEPERTLLVVGPASDDELRELAGALVR